MNKEMLISFAFACKCLGAAMLVIYVTCVAIAGSLDVRTVMYDPQSRGAIAAILSAGFIISWTIRYYYERNN